jgi:hypothetical protein
MRSFQSIAAVCGNLGGWVPGFAFKLLIIIYLGSFFQVLISGI